MPDFYMYMRNADPSRFHGAIQAVRSVHSDGGHYCTDEQGEPGWYAHGDRWPCPTIAALAAALSAIEGDRDGSP